MGRKSGRFQKFEIGNDKVGVHLEVGVSGGRRMLAGEWNEASCCRSSIIISIEYITVVDHRNVGCGGDDGTVLLSTIFWMCIRSLGDRSNSVIGTL